jgi:hypothetical protein
MGVGVSGSRLPILGQLLMLVGLRVGVYCVGGFIFERLLQE